VPNDCCRARWDRCRVVEGAPPASLSVTASPRSIIVNIETSRAIDSVTSQLRHSAHRVEGARVSACAHYAPREPVVSSMLRNEVCPARRS